MLTGTGTAGAYHAGVLRALHEAGVKIDLVAGRGIGAVGAAFAAVDGASQLWDPAGLWRARGAPRLYRWRLALRATAWILGAALGALVLPLGV
ncbi:MAG: patatin-like phospholipase family protein, partial [Acidobacteriota bacterium]|nr:patatin-like phospholipase family protein [Acidobacteriota bacterium]